MYGAAGDMPGEAHPKALGVRAMGWAQGRWDGQPGLRYWLRIVMETVSPVTG